MEYVSILRGWQRRHRVSDGVMKPLLKLKRGSLRLPPLEKGAGGISFRAENVGSLDL